MPGPDDQIPNSSTGVYYLTDNGNTKGLYVYDPAPAWTGTHYWESNSGADGDVGSSSLRCRSTSQTAWSDGLPKAMSCDADGIGTHTCGTQNGWILWHNGAAYMDNNHPCPVDGATTAGAGDLFNLWVCTQKG